MDVVEVEISDKLKISVEDVSYMPSLESLPNRPYPFIYFISITNLFTESIIIKGRKWVIRESNGFSYILEANGVIGQFPILDFGETFKYNSYHLVATNSIVKGAFFIETNNGNKLCNIIPEFKLNVPNWAD